MQKLLNTALLAGLISVAPTASAYLGPGLGMGAIGVILGLLVSVVLAILALFWYPIKRLLRKRRPDTAEESTPAEGEPNRADP